MSGVSSAEELSTTGLIILQKWFDEGSVVHRGPIAFPPTVSLGLLMMTQSMEVGVVCHRVVAVHLQGLEQDGSAHPSRGVFQTQVAQGGYPGLLSEVVIKHGLTATQKEGVYVILQQISPS